jgi:hypothetical protein
LTVLTYRAGIIAADRRVMYADMQRQAPMSKLSIGRSAKYKFVVACAGGSESDEQIKELVVETLNTMRRQPWKGDLSLLILAAPLRAGKRRLLILDYEPREGSLVSYVGAHIPEYVALGSGADVALGSLRHGATATKAVRDAAAHVTTCGDGINYVDTNKPLEKWRIRKLVK